MPCSILQRSKKFDTACQDHDGNLESSKHAIAFASSVSYLEDCRDTSDSMAVFKSADLAKLYSSKLDELEPDVESTVNATRLRNKLLSVFFQI